MTENGEMAPLREGLDAGEELSSDEEAGRNGVHARHLEAPSYAWEMHDCETARTGASVVRCGGCVNESGV